jgi:hypothetical protein
MLRQFSSALSVWQILRPLRMLQIRLLVTMWPRRVRRPQLRRPNPSAHAALLQLATYRVVSSSRDSESGDFVVAMGRGDASQGCSGSGCMTYS